ncbi:MAG TPA: hypothetical protein VMT54_05570 [Candidatus Cybelea sp.]|nr:hypothetical protein [Candidatus Cybelea sp.]
MTSLLTRKPLLVALVGIGLAFGAGYALAAQPHMEAALTALKTAKDQLTIAATDKGGHRVKALDLVNQAITEVQAGITVGAQ